jgi:DNA-binding CsgD family transcriptional regulator
LCGYSLHMKRGRPRHADILTPRECDVLALLREGLTNEEIAERLGMSFYTAKFHVSEILSKLGVSTRDEAAKVLAVHERRWLALPSLGFVERLFHVKPAKGVMIVLPRAAAVAVLALIFVYALPRWMKESADPSTRETLEALADFADPASLVQHDPSRSDDLDGLTLRIVEFFADETRTVVGYEVVGREDEGKAAGPAAPPRLIDASGKAYRTIGAVGGASLQGRQATLVFPAIKPEAGSITLIFDGIVVGKTATHEGVWQANYAWDGGRQSTDRQVSVTTFAQPFGNGTIQIDAVSQVLEGTRVHGHFEGLSPGVRDDMGCPAKSASVGDGPSIGWIGCRLASATHFEITYPPMAGEVQLEFEVSFPAARSKSPHAPRLSPEVLAHEGATATFRVVLPPRP